MNLEVITIDCKGKSGKELRTILAKAYKKIEAVDGTEGSGVQVDFQNLNIGRDEISKRIFFKILDLLTKKGITFNRKESEQLFESYKKSKREFSNATRVLSECVNSSAKEKANRKIASSNMIAAYDNHEEIKNEFLRLFSTPKRKKSFSIG